MSDIVIKKRNEVYLELEAEQHILHEIADYFSFKMDRAKYLKSKRYRHWDGTVKLLDLRNNTIYCGLLYRLTNWADKHDYTWEFKDNKFYGLPYEEDEMVTPVGVEFFMNRIAPNHPARDYQLNGVYQALRYNRKTILSPTASGKSLIIYGITRYHVSNNRNVLVIVPSKQLVKQLKKDFGEYGWDVDNNVQIIYQGYTHDLSQPVVISTWHSLLEHNPKWFEYFDCVIVDECHGCKASSLKQILEGCKDCKYRYGLTGTLTNGDESSGCNKLVIEGLFGPVYQTTKTKELIERGYNARLNTRVILLHHEKQKFKEYRDEIDYLCSYQPRNQQIIDLINQLEGNTLVLFNYVEKHAIPFYEMLIKQTTKDCRIIHGDIDVELREQVRSDIDSGKHLVVVASYGTTSTGINIPKLNNIIFAAPSKSRIRVLQSVGRALRKSKDKEIATLYDIADNFQTNNFTYKHLIERLKYYVEEDFKYDIQEFKI